MSDQNEELNKVKAKIRALLAKTPENGCTEAEAYAAMTKVGELLIQYNLSMSEIDVRTMTCETAIIGNQKNRTSISSCIVGMGKFCDLRIWKNNSGGYGAFGFPQDIEMFRYLFDLVERAIATELESFKRLPAYSERNKGDKKRMTHSFGTGMASRLHTRFVFMHNEMIKERQRAEEAIRKSMKENRITASNDAQKLASPSTSLVVIKMQTVDEQFQHSGVRLKQFYTTKRISSHSAYYAGQSAGDRINITRPIESRGSTKLIS
ncbi:MAG: DUF2786 domain-containing protein [Nitrososphaeraceae archaeon]